MTEQQTVLGGHTKPSDLLAKSRWHKDTLVTRTQSDYRRFRLDSLQLGGVWKTLSLVNFVGVTQPPEPVSARHHGLFRNQASIFRIRIQASIFRIRIQARLIYRDPYRPRLTIYRGPHRPCNSTRDQH